MDNDLKNLRSLVEKTLSEAKKKKEKNVEKRQYEAKPKGFTYSEDFDFSAGLGDFNLYRSQGQVNWGPTTNVGAKVDDVLRGALKEAATPSIWQKLSESTASNLPDGVWESANHWFDHQGLGLGRQTTEGIQKKKAKNKVPAGLAAAAANKKKAGKK